MADRKRRRVENVAGDVYVDATCIDCDTCRWMAPATFGRVGEQSAVLEQPSGDAARRDALRALLACPTASIGTESRHDLAAVAKDFPLVVDGPVHHCGFHHEASFGATAWLIVREAGNVLVDSPRFAAPLVDSIARMGGVKTLFLTHRDDVADHEKWAARFSCERVIHAADARGIEVERTIEGEAPVPLAPDLLAIPTPGHTRGSMCLLAANRYLFTGDHLAHSARLGHVYAFRSACWFDWTHVIASTRKLLAYDFEWVLPGHGRRARHSVAAMKEQLRIAIAWMEGNAPDPDE